MCRGEAVRDVYAARFLLTAPAAFETARGQIAAWCVARYPGLVDHDVASDFTAAPNATDRVEWSNIDSPDGTDRAWSMTFRHADADDPTLGWRVLAELAAPPEEVRFTLRLSQESLEARVRPAIDVPGRPRIVRDLARGLGGFLDGRELTGRPNEVRSDDIAGLVQLLTDTTRRLPVVIASVLPETGRPVTDPFELASQLIGIAHIYSILTVPATYELTDHVGKSLSVFDGAVRIYWPGFGTDADPYVHRLWLARTVDVLDRRGSAADRRDGFARHLLGLVGDVAALRVPPDPWIRALRRDREARVRVAEREEWARLAAEAETIPDAFADEFDRRGQRIEELEFALAIADEERGRLEADNARMARSFADIQAAVSRERSEVDEPAIRASSIPEALELVAAEHPDALVVLRDAYESAGDTRYPQIERASAALLAVAQVAQGWHDGTLGMSFDDAFQEQGFELRSVSEVTRGRHSREYVRQYKGGRVFLSPHLALGDGGSTDTILRIYWHLDEEDRRFVIGHVGRHLPDSST
jgi:hypothetical protein